MLKYKINKKIITYCFIPTLALLIILIYLGFVNKTSDVDIELTADRIQFDIHIDNSFTTNLFSNISLDSLDLSNCTLIMEPKDVREKLSGLAIKTKYFSKIIRKPKEENSQLSIDKFRKLKLKKLCLSNASHVGLTKDKKLLTVRVEDRSNSPTSAIYGDINVGERFSFSGRNIELNGGKKYPDKTEFDVFTKNLKQEITFVKHDKSITLQLDFHVLLENVIASNISFSALEEARKNNRKRSTIKSGNIQITRVDLFKKLFLIKEDNLKEFEFLDIPDDELYFIEYIVLCEDGLKISLFKEDAHELRKGKQVRLLRSIFPSVLDFIIQEPSKKTIWVIFIFVVSQVSTVWYFWKHFGIKKSFDYEETSEYDY